MESVPRGNDTSQVEVSGISPHGIWLFLGDREAFLPFVNFPWFRDAPVAGVLHVERPEPHHLYRPDLDIDLELESILDPGRYPLISRERPEKGSQQKAKPRGGGRKRAPMPARGRRGVGR